MVTCLKNISYLTSTYLILLGDARRRLPLLWLRVLGTSLMDVIGIGLIVPFVSVAMNPEALKNSIWTKPITQLTDGWTHADLVMLLGVIFLIVFICKSILSSRLSYSISAFAFQQDTLLRVTLLERYLNAPYEYHIARDRAHILNSLVQNATKYSSSLMCLLKLFSELVMIISVLMLLLLASPVVFFVLLFSFSGIAFIYLFVIRGQANKWGSLAVSSNEQMLKSIQESIEGLKEIRTLGIENSFIINLKNAGAIAEMSALKLSQFSILPRYFLESGMAVSVVLFVVTLVLSGGNLAEMMPLIALFGLVSLRLLPSIVIVLSSISLIRHSFPAVKSLREDMDSTLAFKSVTPNLFEMKECFQSLELENVSFCYDESDRMIFSNLTLNIKHRQSIGIIGGSGVGKSTLVDLILGLLAPKKGVVLVNGKPLAAGLQAWRQMVAYIPQSPFLSDDSIRKNVALGIQDEFVDEDKVNFAISMSKLEEFIEQLPLGKDTIIGDRGIRISGGQRQRIAIARALYFDRQVLIFDEATSALDSKTECEIVKAISTLHRSKTMIIIAHRMSTLKGCDRIIEIKNGGLIEEYGSVDPINFNH